MVELLVTLFLERVLVLFFAFDVDTSSRIGLVCAHNLVMVFLFNGEVEESSIACRQLESVPLLLLEATMVIMFFLVVIERLLKILS